MSSQAAKKKQSERAWEGAGRSKLRCAGWHGSMGVIGTAGLWRGAEHRSAMRSSAASSHARGTNCRANQLNSPPRCGRAGNEQILVLAKEGDTKKKAERALDQPAKHGASCPARDACMLRGPHATRVKLV